MLVVVVDRCAIFGGGSTRARLTWMERMGGVYQEV